MFSSVGGFRFINAGLGSGIYIFDGVSQIHASQVDSSFASVFVGDNGVANANIITSKLSMSNTYSFSDSLSGTNTNDIPQNLAIDANNNIYIVGSTNANTVGTNDMYVAKYNSTGSLQWQKTLGTTSTDIFYDIEVVDNSGNVIVVGYNADDVTTGSYIGKLNASNGAMQTQIQIGGTSTAPDLCQDLQGNVYVLATDTRDISRNGCVMQKLDTSLNDLLVVHITHSINDIVGTAITVDSSRNIYIGATNSISNDMYLLKLNSSGVLQWQTTFNYSWLHGIESLCVDSSGYIYAAGNLGDGVTLSQVAGLIKFDSSGNIIWQRGLNGYGGTANTNVQQITWHAGRIYMAGYCQYPTNNQGMIIVVGEDGGHPGYYADGFVWGLGPFSLVSTTSLSAGTQTANHSDPGLTPVAGTLTNSSVTITNTVILGP